MTDINWGFLGKVFVVLIMAGWAIWTTVLTYEMWEELAYERAHEEAIRVNRNRDRDRRMQRQRRLLAVADAVVEQENEYQANARKAESMDDTWDVAS